MLLWVVSQVVAGLFVVEKVVLKISFEGTQGSKSHQVRNVLMEGQRIELQQYHKEVLEE